ncbi:hypothetical protein PRIPAC_86267 [Pristionchus pacificus]|uniref:Uncharacterized protein n=1 Tax=Pristionchus pacificus TaxID=54126 RepID=A0A2A6BKK8_PRIPA|nr:hypothetical protein PRIPAC_86267 [Pristionchus pacificus]|eukprot:PDM66452.1 hypothetical protein PRIPAC_47869 [Pristionchus pacificus]
MSSDPRRQEMLVRYRARWHKKRENTRAVNGLASYAAPISLVIFSPSLRVALWKRLNCTRPPVSNDRSSYSVNQSA